MSYTKSVWRFSLHILDKEFHHTVTLPKAAIFKLITCFWCAWESFDGLCSGKWKTLKTSQCRNISREKLLTHWQKSSHMRNCWPMDQRVSKRKNKLCECYPPSLSMKSQHTGNCQQNPLYHLNWLKWKETVELFTANCLTSIWTLRGVVHCQLCHFYLDIKNECFSFNDSWVRKLGFIVIFQRRRRSEIKSFFLWILLADYFS